MVRDTELTDEQFNRYDPGVIVLDPTFLTGSADYRAGLAAPDRFVLLSPFVRSLGKLSLHAEAVPCVCHADSYWKVMGRFRVDEVGRSQIVLLQVPEAQAYLFDSLLFTDFEASVYETLRQDFLAALAAPPNPACQTPEWLEQVREPVGFTPEGNFKALWRNDMAPPK